MQLCWWSLIDSIGIEFLAILIGAVSHFIVLLLIQSKQSTL